jgi:hypothetical protein
VGQVTSTACDQGASYFNAETFKETFESSGGLTATTLQVWEPYRSNRFWGRSIVSLESVLETILDSQDLSLTARKHSLYGSGFKIKKSEMLIFLTKDDYKRKLPVKRRPKGLVETSTDFGGLVAEFCGWKHAEVASMVLKKIECPVVAIRGKAALPLLPSCASLDAAKRNPKADVRSKKARAAEGENHPDQRKGRKLSRQVGRKHKLQLGIEEVREAKRFKNLFVCDTRCPRTKQYCRSEFLSMREKLIHEKRGKHAFPATNANDEAAIKAGQPGGTFASGTRPNLKSKSLFVTIEEASADTLGMQKVVCFEKFNRKELTEEDKYHKPVRLLERMKHYYEIGQDGRQPKLTAKKIHDYLAAEIDPKDGGGLMFCYAKRGSFPRAQLCILCQSNPCDCNGMLPSVKTCSEFINTETQKKRKKATKADARIQG